MRRSAFHRTYNALDRLARRYGEDWVIDIAKSWVHAREEMRDERTERAEKAIL